MPTALRAQEVYHWQHPLRPGLEKWLRFVFCADANAMQAFTADMLESIEAFEKEQGVSVGAHLDYIFPAHLACQEFDTIEFRPLARQPQEAPRTLAFAMVYLPASQAEGATHRCGERPCAMAPVLRQFVHVERLEHGEAIPGWLRVAVGTTVAGVKE